MIIAKKLFLVQLLVLALMLVSCNSFLTKKSNDKVIAVVGGTQLLYSQLKLVTPEGMSETDSISFVQNYIEKWVKGQLLLEKAELNLDKKTLDEIQIMIDNYETSLMVYKYQQMLLKQKLDTIVTDEQVEEYYKNNASNFMLDSIAVKAVFIKIPKSNNDYSGIHTLIRSSNDDDVQKLENFCYQNAQNFTLGDKWLYLNTLLRNIPKPIDDQEAFVRYNRYLEITDSSFRYFMYVSDFKLSKEIAPVELVVYQIKDIILNRRKMKFINDLENNVYNDAVDQKKFTIYAK